MYSEEVICRWTPKAFRNHHYRENKSKKANERQRPGTIKEWISSNVAFEREAKSVKIKYRWFRIPQKQQNLNHTFRSIHFFISKGIGKRHHSDRANPKRTAIGMKKLLKTKRNRSTEIIKYNIPAVRIDQVPSQKSDPKRRRLLNKERPTLSRWTWKRNKSTSNLV